MTRTTVRNAAYYIATRQAFDAGNLRAVYTSIPYPIHLWAATMIAIGLVERLNAAIRARQPEPTYIVVSYYTPIAWVEEDEDPLYVPDVRYSHTTSHHQGICRSWGERPGSYRPETLQRLRTHR